MYLKTGVFVNWGNIPSLEFDFGPINLFSGGNGSGKTTAADGIQSLMTAAHENLFTYNPGQDETTQRGRGGKQVRTLASYLLGCDDGSYSRPWDTDGYVAGVFHPTQGEPGEPFTALMCMRGHLDTAGNTRQARLDNLIFIILPGVSLNLQHFVKEYKDGKNVVPVNKVAELLKKEFGPGAVEVYDKKGPYLRRLYGILRGKKDAVSDREAKHAARTFSNFMAYKPVKSITEFVAREVLEPRDLGDAIRNVSDLMKTIHSMESDARAIIDSLGLLDNAINLSDTYRTLWSDWQLLHYTEASRLLMVNQKAYQQAKQQQEQAQDDIAANTNQIAIAGDRRQQTLDGIVSLEARRQGVDELKEKDRLEKILSSASDRLVAQAGPLLQQDEQLSRNADNIRRLLQAVQQSSVELEVPQLGDKALRKLCKQILDSDAGPSADLQKLLARDWIDIEPLEAVLDSRAQVEVQHNRLAAWLHGGESEAAKEGDGQSRHASETISETLARVVSRQEANVGQARKQLKGLAQDIQRLKGEKVSYPPYVEQALAAIREQCPQARPAVLCDFVEVTDSDWQMAIEGYIGGARFSLIVEPEYEAEAIAIVRRLPGGRSRARVIQGSKAARDAGRLSAGDKSIIALMSFSHKTAQYYLTASYGNVQQVGTADELKHTARGLTSEGLASGNYSMWRCDMNDSELVFGRGARQRALLAQENALLEQQQKVHDAEQRLSSLKELADFVKGIRPVRLTEIIQTMLSAHREIRQAEQALGSLDLKDFTELDEQLANQQAVYREQEQEVSRLTQEAGRLEERLNQCNKKIRDLADLREGLQEAQEDREADVEQINRIDTDFNAEAELAAADQRAAQMLDTSCAAEIEELGQRLETIERQLFQGVQAHNQQCNKQDNIVYDPESHDRHTAEFFARIVALRSELALIHNRLKNNVLVERHEKLSDLKDSFNTAFVTNLCHSIYQSINDGRRVLDDLNNELQHHRFGADRERFYFAYDWVPEYKEYWKFFKEIVAVPNLGDGTTLFDADISDGSARVRDKLLSMLLDRDEQVALRELERISDYRNYRRYEIYKEPEGKQPIALSQYGTGSGGQLETPAYIIRAAAVTSAFKFNEGRNHLRMVLVDEAFSKMDETRSREVINYLTGTLGLQLVFIMPTSKSGPFMDLISNQFVFSKCPTAHNSGELKTRVLVDRQICNREKIQDLWANHRQTIRQQAALDFMEGIA